MFGNAAAIARIARLAGNNQLARQFDAKAAALRSLVEQQLWNPKSRFFESRLETGALAEVRELIGFTPWLFDLPSPKRGYETAWNQLMDPRGFHAPFGPTTAEQPHPGFRIAESGDDCQWNGPSWPFSTTVTLKALANLLNGRQQSDISIKDYFETLLIYAGSHRLKFPDGGTVAFVDENLNPFTGDWHARSRKISKGSFNGRGDHYNNSAFADLIITGLAGLRPRADNSVEVNPLLPPASWDWFCLDGVPYHGSLLTILWDRDGRRFGRGAALSVYADGRRIARAPKLQRIVARLP
jgi:hypothetical protein